MTTHGGQGFHCAIAFNIASRWDGPEDFVEISVAGRVLNEIIVERNAMKMCMHESKI
jgi:hypothetical protein